MTRPLLALALGVALLSGCGEKIDLPFSEGIAVDSDYVDITPRALAGEFDWVTDLEFFGGYFAVLDSARGRLVVIDSDGDMNDNVTPVEGLDRPVALDLDTERNLLLVVVGGPGAYRLEAYTPTLELELGADLDPVIQGVSDIATDGQFIYVGDPVARTVHRIALSPAPSFGPLVMQGTMVAPDPTQFDVFSPQIVSRPGSLTIDDMGYVVVCDTDSTRNWVLRYDPRPRSGQPAEAPGRSVIFGATPEQVASNYQGVDPSRLCGNVPSLAASTLGRAPSCSPSGDFQLVPSAERGAFHTPSGIAIDGEGNHYVADRYNGRIQRFDMDGTYVTDFGPGLTLGDDALLEPVRVAVWDGRKNLRGERVYIPGARVLVVDGANGRLRIYEDSRWTQIEQRSE